MSTATAAPRTSYSYASICERRLARPLLSSLVIVGCDLATLTFVITTAVLLRYFFGGQYEIVSYLRLWPLLGLFLVAFASYGLYPGIVITPVSELRKTTEASTLVFLVLAAGTFVMRHRITYSRTIFFVAWLGIILLIPLARACVRHRAGRRDWWGYPVIIFGSGRIAEKIVFRLQQHPEHGLRPFAVLGGTGAIGDISGVPLAGGFERAPEFVRLGITHALIAISDKVHWQFAEKIESEAKLFPNIIVVPDMPEMSSLLVETRDCCRMFTLQTRNNLLLRGPQLAKRIFDVVSSIVAGLLLLPLGVLISIAIRMDSPGSATYAQRRIGRAGKPFPVRKFRTMVTNADDLLFAHLRSHPADAEEWKRDHKLRDDPQDGVLRNAFR